MFYYFSGNAGEDIVVPYSAAHAITGDMEIEVIIRILRNNASGAVICFGGYDNSGAETAANNALYSLIVSGQRLAVNHEYGNGSNFGHSGPITLPLDWIRVRMVRTGLTYTIYVNGEIYTQATFTSSQAPSNGSAIGSSGIRVGNGYIEQMTPLRLTYVNLTYVKVKNGSGAVVYELGDDPGTNRPPISARFLDPYSTMVMRPVQQLSGRIEVDPLGPLPERSPQRKNGYSVEVTAGDRESGEETPSLNTPRSYPLESSWKRANAEYFSK